MSFATQTTLPRLRPSRPHPTLPHVRVVTSCAELQRYEADWNQLAWSAPHCPPSQSGAWAISVLETITGSGKPWICLLALEGDRLLGVLPLLVEPHPCLGARRPRLVAPQKEGMLSGEFLAVAGREAEVIPLLLHTLRRHFPRLYEISLLRIPRASPSLPLISRCASGYIPIQEPGSLGSFLTTTGSIESYRTTLSRNFSRNLIKARNKLVQLPAVRFIFLTGAEADESWLPRFLDLEASGWKGDQRSAITHRAGLLDFCRRLTRRLHSLGWLEWHVLLSGERLLAAHLAIKMGQRLTLHKIAYDEAFARCAPGNLLLERTLQRAFACPDTHEVDCEFQCPWHDNWAMEQRTYCNVWLYPREFLSLAGGLWPRRAWAALHRSPALRAVYHYLCRRITPRRAQP